MQPKRAGAGADAPATPADDDDPSSAIEFVPIRAGVFQMGTPASEADHIDTESPVHEVTLDAFELSKFEITNAQYAAFLDANQAVQRPKGWRDDLPPDQPATGMTWAEAHQFAQWADASLPTEAQWEYAARAGSSGSRYGQLSDIAWVPENADGHVHAVGELAPNVWGTHDMLGNVWEWCSDLFGPYPEGAVTNPVGASQGANRAIRGGSFGFESKFARAGGRFANDPGNRSDNLGIRLVRDSRDK